MIKERLRSETPEFFKQIRKYAYWGLLVAAVGTSVAVPLSFPLWLTVILGAIDTAAVTVIGMSSLTKK